MGMVSQGNLYYYTLGIIYIITVHSQECAGIPLGFLLMYSVRIAQ